MSVRLKVRLAAILAVASVLGLSACATASPRAGSSPTATAASTPTPTPTPEAVLAVSKMSVRDRLASLLVLHSPGTDPASLQAFVQSLHPGGLIFMSDNIPPDLAMTAALAQAVQVDDQPLVLAVDQEGGWVTRLPGDTFPAGAALAGSPVAETTAAFDARAALVQAAGLNTNYGVVADITGDTGSFIHGRVLGETPDASAARVRAAVEAESGRGIISTLKHFPGHGAAPGDSHTSLPTTALPLAQWRTHDAVPFIAGIEAGADMVMVGHLVYSEVDALPASLSPAWHQVLRDELNFDGVIVSDDMGMLENSGDPRFVDRIANAIAALMAGTTMLVIVADGPTPITPTALLDGLEAAVTDGRLPIAIINDAAERVWDLRDGLAS